MLYELSSLQIEIVSQKRVDTCILVSNSILTLQLWFIHVTLKGFSVVEGVTAKSSRDASTSSAKVVLHFPAHLYMIDISGGNGFMHLDGNNFPKHCSKPYSSGSRESVLWQPAS